jgi:cyclase
MLKPRLIAVLVVYDRIVVQSINFNCYLPVGDLSVSVQFLNDWGIDEISILDIDATKQKREPDFRMLETAVENSKVPVSIGGGINNLSAVRNALLAGADKVVINREFIERPAFITEIASNYGSQCAVVSIDAIEMDGTFYCYNYLSGRKTEKTVAEAIVTAASAGAGEILLKSVCDDGRGSGMNLKLAKSVVGLSEIPLVLAGGAGQGNHILDALKIPGVQSVAAANIFNHFEHSPMVLKSFLKMKGIPQRKIDNCAYASAEFDLLERPVR